MELTEPQVWTLIAVFAAIMIGAITLLLRQNDRIITSFRNENAARFDSLEARFDGFREGIDARFDGLREAVDARFDGLNGILEVKFDAIDARFDAMDTKFTERLGSIDRRLEDLDKEVANLATRFWKSS